MADPIYTTGDPVWNSLEDNTRVPLTSELESGWPCGEVDPELLNFVSGHGWNLIHNMLTLSGLTPSIPNLHQLAQAVQAGKINYAIAGGTANALTATLSPAPPALTVGMVVYIKAAASNTTTTPTLNLNGFGAATIIGNDGSALATNSFVPGLVAGLQWDGTNWRLVTLTAATTPPRNIVTYATPGTYNFTVPTGIYKVFARVWGGGGGGGGTGAATNAGGGGGGGEYREGWFDVVPAAVIAVTVGARGTAGAASNTGIAGTGGTSSFGAFISAIGGGGGANGIGSGGLFGTGGSGGSFNFNGGGGYDGGYFIGNTSFPFGGAGAPAYGQPLILPGFGGGSVAGYGFGSGGSGSTSTSGALAGSVGAAGAVILEY